MNDEFRAGDLLHLSFTRRRTGATMQMVQRFCVYEENDFFNYRLVHRGGRATTFQLSGSGVGQPDVCPLLESEDNRMLKVPFDNDGGHVTISIRWTLR